MGINFTPMEAGRARAQARDSQPMHKPDVTMEVAMMPPTLHIRLLAISASSAMPSLLR